LSDVDYKKALSDPRAFAEESGGKWLEWEFGDACRAAKEHGLNARLQQSRNGSYLALCVGDAALVTATIHGDGDAVMSVRPTVKVPVHSRSEARAVLCEVLAAFVAKPKDATEANQGFVICGSWEHRKIRVARLGLNDAWVGAFAEAVSAMGADPLPRKNALDVVRSMLKDAIKICDDAEHAMPRSIGP